MIQIAVNFWMARVLCGLAFVVSLAMIEAPALAGAQRVVSLNPCLDTILVHVADREQIAALSHYARDPHSSSIAEIAKTFPIVHETAEEVIMRQPDLVLAGIHNNPATRKALAQLGIREVSFVVPESVDDSIDQVREVAKLVGQEARGEEVVARIAAALVAARPTDARKFSALIFQPNGLSPSKGTLSDDMLARTGFVNAAERYTFQKWQNVPLERLIADPPDVLLAGELAPGRPTWVDRIMTHPALKGLRGRTLQATFSERLLYCGGPVLIETAAVLAQVRAQLMAARP